MTDNQIAIQAEVDAHELLGVIHHLRLKAAKGESQESFLRRATVAVVLASMDEHHPGYTIGQAVRVYMWVN